MAYRATRGGTERTVMMSKMPGSTTYHRAFHAALGISCTGGARNRKRQNRTG